MKTENNTIKAVVFDMDGVLYDTERISMKSWLEVGKQMDVPEVEEAARGCIGMNRKGMFDYFYEKYGKDFPVETFLNATREHTRAAIVQEGLPLMPGAREVLEALTQAGYLIALATSTRTEVTEGHLEKTQLRHYFKAVICGDMIENSKPAPDIYVKACRALDVEPQQAAAIEDSPNGIRSAHAAGMHPIMVPDMIVPTPEIQKLLWKQFDSLSAVQQFFAENSFLRR